MSETLTTQANSAELEAIAATVAQAQAQEFDDSDVQTPILKLAQGLTNEVVEGDADSGEFINTLTSEPLGDTVEFIFAFYRRGRFASDKASGRAYSAFTPDIPAHWAELPFVGEHGVGVLFTEHPEAEEEYRAACNSNQREWGSGPPISTTHNYIGLVLTDDGPQPVRLSLKRTEKGAINKLNTLHRTGVIGKSPWDRVLTLSSTKKKFGRNESFIVNPAAIKMGRETTPEEREMAALLAIAASQGRIAQTGDDDAERIAEPDAKGGLGI